MTISIPGDPKDFSPSNSENYTKIQRSQRNFVTKQIFTTEREEARIRGTRKWLEKETFGFSNPNIYPPQHATDLSSFRRRTGIADN